MTSALSVPVRRPESQSGPSLTIYLTVLWNVVVAIGGLLLCRAIFAVDPEFFGLGRPVQTFLALAALVPAILATLSSILLVLRRPMGRYLALIINFVGLALGTFYLLHLWDAFTGIDQLSSAVLHHYAWLLAIPAAWALYMLAGQLPEQSRAQAGLERLAILIGMIGLVVFLWNAGILDAANNVLSRYSNPAVWAATGVVAICAILGWRMLHLARYFHETLEQQEAWQGWLMLSPNIIGFMVFFAGPLLLSLYLGFTNDRVGSIPEFIGLRNYSDILSLQIKTQTDLSQPPQAALDAGYAPLDYTTFGGTRYVLGAKDEVFWFSLRNTILYCLLLLPLSVIPALALAIVMNSKIPGMKVFRAVYFLPSVAAVVGIALIWRWLYDPTTGYINYTISQLVDFLNRTFGLSITDPKVEWTSHPSSMLISMVIMSAWQTIGFNTVLFLAGLQGIPRILYEAAYVDGANRWGQFRNVTLPLLAPTTFFVMITTVITALQVFNEPYALIPSRPMPLAATTSVFYLYNRGFFRFEFGYASAVAWVLFALIFVVTLAQFRLQRSQAYEN